MSHFFQEHEAVGNIQRMTYLSDLEQRVARKQLTPFAPNSPRLH